MSIIGYTNLTAAPLPLFLTAQVQALFAKYSAAGGMWDFTDMATLFQDSAGTTPVTAASQPVGRVLDISGLGATMHQPSAGGRPIYNGAGITFDGVDDGVATASNLVLGSPTGVSYFFRAVTTDFTGWREFFFYGNNGEGGTWLAGKNQIQAHRDPGGYIEVSAAGSADGARWHRILAGAGSYISVSAVFDYAAASSSVSGVVDGVAKSAPVAQVGNLGGTVVDSTLNIRVVQGSLPPAADYKRLMFIGASLSPEDASIVSAWLAEVAP